MTKKMSDQRLRLIIAAIVLISCVGGVIVGHDGFLISIGSLAAGFIMGDASAKL